MRPSAALHVFLVVYLWCAPVAPAAPDEVYPHGGDTGDRHLPKGDDLSSPQVPLTVPIKYFGELYDIIYVSNNGLLSFVNPLPEYHSVQFPLEYLVIAPLYANVDTSKEGTVWYRETQDQELLERAGSRVRDLFPDHAYYAPTSLFVATWDGVGHPNSTNERNTFQAALSTDGDESFVELIYPDGGIQWIQTKGEGHAIPDAKAQAGLVSHDGRLYTLRGSGTDQVQNLDKWTNGHTPGIYVLRIGNIGETENVQNPPSYKEEDDYDEYSIRTCETGYTRCHSKAKCYDTSLGFCCKCKEGYYGNGRECLKEHIPLRANGKVQVNVNGISSSQIYLQAYILPNDGASYTAVSNVPQTLGYEMQLLEGLGSLLGWLFAKPIHDAVNGYQLTGGVFNHTCDITFDTGHRIHLKQHYLGLDIFDQLKMEAEITGTLPTVLPKSTLSLPDFQEQFTPTEQGVFRSQANHIIKVDGMDHEFTKVQTIRYHEPCPEKADEVSSLRLKSARHTLLYKPEEGVLRFASFNKISKNIEGEDPCLEGQVKCVANSSCLVDGDSFKCICNPGFEAHYSNSGDDLGCRDINECLESSLNCDLNAICVNEVGTFHCQCMPGFEGDGKICTPMEETNSCDDDPSQCQPKNGYCENPEVPESCMCENGFRITYGRRRIECVDIDECFEAQPCHYNADCYNTEGGFNCECKSGLRGDGISVCDYPSRTCDSFNCPFGSHCEENYNGPSCVCDAHLVGTPPNCKPGWDQGQEGEVEKTCSSLSCGSGSHCEEDFNGPRCVCDLDYVGTPPNCKPIWDQKDDCQIDQDCGPEAVCNYDNGNDMLRCECLEGYEGDGYHCEPLPLKPPEDISEYDRPSRVVKTCLDGRCWCPPLYEERNNLCEKTSDEPQGSCKTLNNCHEHAQCIYWHGSYQCKCNAGYEGDGYFCSEMDISCSMTGICGINASCKYDETTGRDVCICNEGFQGDGITCYSSDECSSSNDCKRNEGCVYSPSKGYHECICPDGFYTDSSGNCLSSDNGYGFVCSSCHYLAECLPDDNSPGEYICRCRNGLIGDGITDCREHEPEAGCEVRGNCSPYADCVYSQEENKHICVCFSGYEGDGYNCMQIENCYHNPEICHEYASCVRIDYGFQCRCNDGYIGNGTFCRERPVHQGGFILLNQGRSTLQLPFHPSSTNRGRPIHLHQDQLPVGIAIDCVEGRVYWSDISKKTIQSSNYDGTDMQDFITEDIESSEGLTIDWVNRAIYWTDSVYDTISKASLDTKEKMVIISDNLVNPRGIAVHPWKRKIYWSDWDRKDPKIESANLNGRGRAALVKGPHVKLPNSLAIDWQTDELCWADAGLYSIECLKLSSGLVRTAVKECKYPFGLAITPERYYWTSWVTNKIESADKNGVTQKPLQQLLGGDDKLYGIVAVTNSCP